MGSSFSMKAAAAGLVLLAAAGGALVAGPLEGRWTLVEQRYGKGSANQVDLGEPELRLEFVREAATLAGKVRGEGGPTRPWPAWRTGTDVDVLERFVSPDEKSVRVRYRVVPAPGDDVTLDVVESYRVEGGSLVGTVDVVFVQGGEPGGSYRLHRRFERAP